MERLKVEYLRLHTIDSEIRTERYPNAASLAKTLEVNERTILRDIAFMKDMLRAPIAYSRERRGYYYTSPHFTISDISLDSDEALALLLNGKLALQFLRDTNLFDRIRFGMESLERRAAAYNAGADKELSARIQLAIETPPISVKPEFEELLFDSMVKGRLLQITLESGETFSALPLMTVLYKRDWGLFYMRPSAFGDDFASVRLSDDVFAVVSLWSVQSIRPYKDLRGKEITVPSQITYGYENVRLAHEITSEQSGDDLLCISCMITRISTRGATGMLPHPKIAPAKQWECSHDPKSRQAEQWEHSHSPKMPQRSRGNAHCASLHKPFFRV